MAGPASTVSKSALTWPQSVLCMDLFGFCLQVVIIVTFISEFCKPNVHIRYVHLVSCSSHEYHCENKSTICRFEKGKFPAFD